MLKTPLSTVIGGVGFYTKNTLVIGGHKSKPEPPFDPASLFANGEIGTLLDCRLNVDEKWRVNLVHSTTNPDLWLNAFTYTSMLNNAYQLTLTDEKSSGIGLGALSTYPAGTKIEANKTVYRSVEVKKVDAKYLRFGAAADGSTVFVDLETLEVLRNAGNIQCLIERLSDGFIRISTFVYHSASPSATHASNLLGWGNVRLAASLSETLGKSLIVRKPVFGLLDGYDLDTPKYQEIITADAAFLEAHPNHMLFQDTTGFVPITALSQPVGLVKSSVSNAQQIDSAKKPLLQNDIKFDGIDDALNIAFPSALTNCTIFSVKHGGQAQILEAQSVAQNHIINQDFKYYGIVNRALTSAERAGLVSYLNKVGAK